MLCSLDQQFSLLCTYPIHTSFSEICDLSHFLRCLKHNYSKLENSNVHHEKKNPFVFFKVCRGSKQNIKTTINTNNDINMRARMIKFQYWVYRAWRWGQCKKSFTPTRKTKQEIHKSEGLHKYRVACREISSFVFLSVKKLKP